MSAVEISRKPVAPLLDYLSRTENRSVDLGTSQCDGDKLREIVLGELADELDLVVDDASHTYEETRSSFEFLFPLLSPGGIYVIEDWSWAHHPDYQSPDAPFSSRRALSNLLFEQIMLMGSTLLISEIRVWRFLYLIHKAKGVAPSREISQKVESGSIFDHIISRGKQWSLIELGGLIVFRERFEADKSQLPPQIPLAVPSQSSKFLIITSYAGGRFLCLLRLQ